MSANDRGGPLQRLARGFAIGGGVLFCALIGVSLVSIVGRKLFATPILGDQEIMMFGTAIAAAALLPYCELRDLNIKVDVVTQWAPPRVKGSLDAIAHLLLTVMALVIVWRTGLQTLQDWRSGDGSQILHLPQWLVDAALLPSFLLLSVCALARALRSWRPVDADR